MESLFRYIAAPSAAAICRTSDGAWNMNYVAALTPDEYLQRMLDGWRRFGLHALSAGLCNLPCLPGAARPRRSFCPDRSQKRAWKINQGVVELHIGRPSVTKAKLALYDGYHDYQAGRKGWPQHPPKTPPVTPIPSFVTLSPWKSGAIPLTAGL